MLLESRKRIDVTFKDFNVPKQAPANAVRLWEQITAPELLKCPGAKAEEGGCIRHA